MYVYMNVCMYVCMCVCVCVYIYIQYIYIYIYICMCVCIYIYITYHHLELLFIRLQVLNGGEQGYNQRLRPFGARVPAKFREDMLAESAAFEGRYHGSVAMNAAAAHFLDLQCRLL